MYDKKMELLQRCGVRIEDELTRFEIVYKPDKKILMGVLVHFPPQFNRLKQMRQRPTLDFDRLAEEQWEDEHAHAKQPASELRV